MGVSKGLLAERIIAEIEVLWWHRIRLSLRALLTTGDARPSRLCALHRQSHAGTELA